MQHFASSGKFYATATLLTGILVVLQYGCISAPLSGTAGSPQDSSLPVRHDGCPGSPGNVAACDSMAQKMQQMKRPENIDELFANLRYLVYNDMLRNPIFYSSNEYLLKAFGEKSINHSTQIDGFGINPSITIQTGNLPTQQCSIFRFRDAGIQAYCGPEALFYFYTRNASVENDSSLKKIHKPQMIDVIYEKFRNTFDKGWKYTNALTEQSGTWPSQPAFNMLEKYVQIGDTDYRIVAGHANNHSMFGGITISEIKHQPPNTLNPEQKIIFKKFRYLNVNPEAVFYYAPHMGILFFSIRNFLTDQSFIKSLYYPPFYGETTWQRLIY